MKARLLPALRRLRDHACVHFQLYVSPSGNDANTGTQARAGGAHVGACRDLARAQKTSTVIVAAGVYRLSKPRSASSITRSTTYLNAAISMGWGSWPDRIKSGVANFSKENVVSNNLIFNLMLVLADGGGIYTQGITGNFDNWGSRHADYFDGQVTFAAAVTPYGEGPAKMTKPIVGQ